MQRRGYIGLSLLVLTIALLLGYGFWPRPVPIDSVTVQRAPLRVDLEEEGRTRVIDRYRITAPVSGFLQRIALDVGSPLKAGDVVGILDPLPAMELDPRSRASAESRITAAQAALEAARERMRAAEAEAEFAQLEHRRLKRLYQDKVVSKDALEKADTVARGAAATAQSRAFEVEIARYELEAARTALRYSLAEETPAGGTALKLRAPIDGQVLALHQKSAGVVQAGQPLLEIGDPRSLEVYIELLSEDAVKLQPGMAVVLERWGGEHDLQAQVSTVEPVGYTKLSALGVEEQRVGVVVRISSPYEQWSRLGDGYRVDARFILWQGEAVLQVPASALFRHQSGWGVFVVQGGRAQLRPVTIAHENGLSVEISAGLNEGEQLVLHPNADIGDGRSVKQRP